MSKVEVIRNLGYYIESNVAPILVDNISARLFIDEAVFLPSNCDVSLLNGHYEGMDFVPPLWYVQVLKRKDSRQNILVIDDLTNIPKEEQMKFYELLKYRKIGVFDLPENCVIIATANKLIYSNVDKQIYSLFAHIRG